MLVSVSYPGVIRNTEYIQSCISLWWLYLWSSNSTLNYIKFSSLICSYLFKLKHPIFCFSLAHVILKEIFCSMLDHSLGAHSHVPPSHDKISCPWSAGVRRMEALSLLILRSCSLSK